MVHAEQAPAATPEIKLTLGPVQTISLTSEKPAIADPFGPAQESRLIRKAPMPERRNIPLLDAPGPGYRKLSGEVKELAP